MLRQGRQLTSYDEQSITYDAIGNPTNYMGATMTWFARQMQSYSKNGTNITYTYDADGLRTQKVVGGIKHEYYYVDGQLRYEKNGDSYEMNYRYDADGRPILATKRDLTANQYSQYYLITNTRGDVVETRDGNGNVSAKYTYDSWGKLISVTDANGNALASDSFAHQISLRYRGYVYDNETGLYYLQSRYYDPEVGRFLNADDVDFIGYSGEALSYNMFAYCENNAMNCVDPWGTIVSSVIITRILLNVLGYVFIWAVKKYLIYKNFGWTNRDTLDLIAAILGGLTSSWIGGYFVKFLSRFFVSVWIGIKFYIFSFAWNGPPRNKISLFKGIKEVLVEALF